MNWIRRLNHYQRVALVMAAVFCVATAIYVVRQMTPGVYWDGRFLKRVDAGRYERDDEYEITLVETKGGVTRFLYRFPGYEYSLDEGIHDGYGDDEFIDYIEGEAPVREPREAVMTVTPDGTGTGVARVSVTYGQDEIGWEGIASGDGELTTIEGDPIELGEVWVLEDGRMLRDPSPSVLYRIAEDRVDTRGHFWGVLFTAPLFAFFVVAYLYPVQVRLFGSRWAFETEPVYSEEAIMLMRGGAIAAMVITTAIFYLMPI